MDKPNQILSPAGLKDEAKALRERAKKASSPAVAKALLARAEEFEQRAQVASREYLVR